jgi:hypothetical protein
MIPCAEGGAGSRSDSNTGSHQVIPGPEPLAASLSGCRPGHLGSVVVPLGGCRAAFSRFGGVYRRRTAVTTAGSRHSPGTKKVLVASTGHGQHASTWSYARGSQSERRPAAGWTMGL